MRRSSVPQSGRRPGALRDLVDELEDLGVYAGGRTLIVPATESERQAAVELATELSAAPWLALEATAARPAALLGAGAAAAGAHAAPAIVTPPPPFVHDDAATIEVVVEPAADDVASRIDADILTVDDVPQSAVSLDAASLDSASRQSDPEPAASARGQRRASARARKLDRRATQLLTPVPRASREVKLNDDPAQDGSVIVLSMKKVDDSSPITTVEPEVQALRRRPSDPEESRTEDEQAVALAWHGALSGPRLRRAARLVDRVIVLVSDGTLSRAELPKMQVRLGREDGIGFLLVGADDSHIDRKDRVGPVAQFWATRRRRPA